MDRQTAYSIVTEFVKNENLIKHMLSVEAAMRAYAVKFGEDPDDWALPGLLHDFDWEIHPNLDEHPMESPCPAGRLQNCSGAFVCHCLKVTEAALLAALGSGEIGSVRDIIRHTEAGSGCTACHSLLRRYLEQQGYFAAASPICSVR